MVGDVEERIQIYTEEGSREEIVTLRRYARKEETARLLEKAGLCEIRVVDGYDPSGWHMLRPDEATTGSYVVTARRP
jgi:hypothetical protein